MFCDLLHLDGCADGLQGGSVRACAPQLAQLFSEVPVRVLHHHNNISVREEVCPDTLSAT